LQSLYKTYPLLKSNTNNNQQRQLLNNKIISTSYNNDSYSDSDNNNNTNNHTNKEHNNAKYNHIQDYLNNIKNNTTLRDGVESLEVGKIVAAQSDRANGLPWFGKVQSIVDGQTVEILWLHKENAKYYYLDDTTSEVHNDAIICNGVEFEPVFKTKLMWKLITPLSLIQALNSDNLPILSSPLQLTSQITQKPKSIDITSLNFNNKKDFQNFLYSQNTNKQ
jgi:hypothetical protein